MKSRTTIHTFVLLVCALIGGEKVLGQETVKNLYMGLQPPGLIPEKFMPGKVSTDESFEFIFTISADKATMLFTRRVNNADIVMVSNQTSDGWSNPEPFGLLNDVGAFEQHMSPVRDRIYFSRLAPPPGVKFEGPPKTREEEAMLVGVWYIDRTDSGWSEPKYCTHGMYVTTTRDGSIYTTDIRGPVGVSCSRIINDKFADLQLLGGGVNNPEPGAHPCIAHDETFIVFDSERNEGYGKSDLYVCFSDTDGNWSDAINLGDNINTEGIDFCPSLSPDGRYLFFSSNHDIYWIDVQAIVKLRPGE